MARHTDSAGAVMSTALPRLDPFQRRLDMLEPATAMVFGIRGRRDYEWDLVAGRRADDHTGVLGPAQSLVQPFELQAAQADGYDLALLGNCVVDGIAEPSHSAGEQHGGTGATPAWSPA